LKILLNFITDKTYRHQKSTALVGARSVLVNATVVYGERRYKNILSLYSYYWHVYSADSRPLRNAYLIVLLRKRNCACRVSS